MRVLAGSARRHHVPGTPKGSSGRKPQQRDVRGLATGLLSACCREIAVNGTQAIAAGPTGQPILDGLAFEFNTQTPGVLDWISERGAEFVTRCTEEQKDAIAALLEKKNEREPHSR